MKLFIKSFMVEMLRKDWSAIMQYAVARKVLCSVTDTAVESQFQALFRNSKNVHARQDVE